MKQLSLLFLLLFFAGCVANNSLQYASIAEDNLYHIARVRKGMEEKEVLQIMHKPYSYESFQVEDDIYDVWFYVTRATGLEQSRMVPQNLTPLTFKNGVLVGTGYYWYYYAMKEQAEETANYHPAVEKKKSQADEDKAFEKALKTYPKQEQAPPAKPHKLPQKTTQAPKASCDPLFNPSIGMSEQEVEDIMGEPDRKRAFEWEGNFYDVWFYETLPNKTGRPSSIPQKATPYIFKNSLLVSTSEEEYFQMEEALADQAAQISFQLQEERARSKGMVSEKELDQVHRGFQQDQVRNYLGDPIRKEAYVWKRHAFDVWFYQTHSSDEETPLTFKDGVLISKSDRYYRKMKKKAEPKPQEEEEGVPKEIQRGSEEESEQNFDYW